MHSTPTVTSMRDLLDTLSANGMQERDVISYLAGFTHYPEAQSLLQNYGLSVDAKGYLHDKSSNMSYVKIVISDPDRIVNNMLRSYLLRKNSTPYYNEIKMWNKVSECYTDAYQPANPHESFLEYNQNLDKNYEMSVKEDVLFYRAQGKNTPLTYCVSKPTALNLCIDLKRHLRHTRVLLCCPAKDIMPNISIPRLLRHYGNLESSTQKPIWILLNNDYTETMRLKIEQQGFSCLFLDFQTPHQLMKDIENIIHQDLHA